MSYEVDDKKDVREKLDELGIDSVDDVRRAGGARHRDVPALIEAERLDLTANGSPDAMAAVPDELVRISRCVSDVRDHIHELLGEVRHLAGHQFDGWGPIAKRMAACMTDRASAATGAELAVNGYLAELAALDAALNSAAVTYATRDQENAANLRRAVGDCG
ncbi:MAG: hypothetical protein WBA97_01285 [Actinophytocola sp.]|uniref:hypothetical protein n=1 Tax=Actinophytocola sp. TaxID=1872138 RepID=UPI003C75D8D5